MSNENSIELDPKRIPTARDVLSTLGQPRIAPYVDFFKCATDEAALGAYFWGQAIASAFQPCLGMYEVALRNAIHVAASRFSSKQSSHSHPWYDYTRQDSLPLRGKTREKVTALLFSGSPPVRLASQPSPDSVVAALSFGFWPSFLAGLTRPQQSRIFTDTFHGNPNSKPAHWSNTDNVASLLSTLKEIQDLRNAVAHLEPIWKPHRLKIKATHWSHSVASLRQKHAAMIQVMAWCCPASAAAVEHSYANRIFKSICSTDAVQAFMHNPFDAGEMSLFALGPGGARRVAAVQQPAANEAA
ncbi:hypothetical protein [Massilia suwonensis]|uniref:Abi-like protein n=1 Tax=Massilia suwonensis TaxID=648895 RepID=A0ABW0MJZ4_9BURK